MATQVTQDEIASPLLGYTSTTTTPSTTASTTDVSLGVDTTVTVPFANRKVRITVYLIAGSTVTGDEVRLNIKESGTILGIGQAVATAAKNSNIVAVAYVVSPSVGSHTYQAFYNRGSGTGTVSAVTTTNFPIIMTVELL